MDSSLLNNLVGVKFNQIFKQLGLFIINFGEQIKYSLHIASMVRIYRENKIILTTSDEFFTKDGLEKSSERYQQLDAKCILTDTKDLLAKNLKIVNTLLKNAYVEKVETTKCMDLFIHFNNNVVIQIFPDCLAKNYEYYRFIEFMPALSDDSNKYTSEHYVLLNDNGELIFKRES